MDNVQDSIMHGTRFWWKKRELHPNAKLIKKEVLEIRRLRSEGVPTNVLADRFEVNPTTIRRIVKGEAWSHLPGPRTVVGQARGERAGSSKLSAESVREIRRLWEQGETTQKSLAKQFGVAHSTIGGVVRRKTWKHIK